MSKVYEEIQGIKVNPRIYIQMWRCNYEKCQGGCCWKDTTEAYFLGGELLKTEAHYLKKFCKYKGLLYEQLAYLPLDQLEVIETGGVLTKGGRHFTKLLDDGRCCFVDMEHGRCALKQPGSALDIPIHCQLFPLVWEDKVLDFSDERYFCEDSEAYGIKTGTYVIEFCEQAIRRMFRDDFFNALLLRAYDYRRGFGLPIESAKDSDVPPLF